MPRDLAIITVYFRFGFLDSVISIISFLFSPASIIAIKFSKKKFPTQKTEKLINTIIRTTKS